MAFMPAPESINHVAILDATITDLLAAKGIDFSSLPAARKFELRNNLMPVLNALIPHVEAQLTGSGEASSPVGSFVVPDTLEGLIG